MHLIVMTFHVLIAVAIVVLVLLQQGKGAQAGAAFGSGASQTFFGSKGATSFLFKLTAGLGALFIITSLSLGYMASKASKTNNQSTNIQISQPVPATIKQQNTKTITVPKKSSNNPSIPSVPLQ